MDVEQKHTMQKSRDRSFTKLFQELESPDPERRSRAVTRCWRVAPYAGAILASLLRGLTDSDEDIRFQAFRGLISAFPKSASDLGELAGEIETFEPKVRLAIYERVIRILTKSLADTPGMKLEPSSLGVERPVPTMEDPMEHAGQWVAWTQDRQRVLAVSDSFADVMDRALKGGESDPYVRKSPGIAEGPARSPIELVEDESPNIVDDVNKVVPDADVWLNTPNVSLGGEKPRDLINTDRELNVRYLLRGIIDGIPT